MLLPNLLSFILNTWKISETVFALVKAIYFFNFCIIQSCGKCPEMPLVFSHVSLSVLIGFLDRCTHLRLPLRAGLIFCQGFPPRHRLDSTVAKVITSIASPVWTMHNAGLLPPVAGRAHSHFQDARQELVMHHQDGSDFCCWTQLTRRWSIIFP